MHVIGGPTYPTGGRAQASTSFVIARLSYLEIIITIYGLRIHSRARAFSFAFAIILIDHKPFNNPSASIQISPHLTLAIHFSLSLSSICSLNASPTKTTMSNFLIYFIRWMSLKLILNLRSWRWPTSRSHVSPLSLCMWPMSQVKNRLPSAPGKHWTMNIHRAFSNWLTLYRRRAFWPPEVNSILSLLLLFYGYFRFYGHAAAFYFAWWAVRIVADDDAGVKFKIPMAHQFWTVFPRRQE